MDCVHRRGGPDLVRRRHVAGQPDDSRVGHFAGDYHDASEWPSAPLLVTLFQAICTGVITAVLLLIPLSCYVAARAVQQGYVPILYVAVWAVVLVLGLAQTVRAGNKMTPFIRAINNIGIMLANRTG